MLFILWYLTSQFIQNWGMQFWSLGWKDPLKREMATHSSILAWEIPWTERPGGLQSMGLQSVRHNLATKQTNKRSLCPCWGPESTVLTLWKQSGLWKHLSAMKSSPRVKYCMAQGLKPLVQATVIKNCPSIILYKWLKSVYLPSQ